LIYGEKEEYDIEAKLQTLNNRGEFAKIDAHLENQDTQLFIESKFTEMFCDNNQDIYLIAKSCLGAEHNIDKPQLNR
jgi:hypothetical protein